MKKLYDKSEIIFAILWIVVYVMGMGTLRGEFGDTSPHMMVGLIVISGLMLLFVCRNGLLEEYGLSGWAKNNRAMLWFIPVWIIASGNLWGGFGPDYPMPGLAFAAISMALVGFAEELIFRGFLFKAMLRDGSVVAAIVVSSVTFGIGHIMNLFIGQDFFETIMQMIGAIAIGFVFTFAFYKGGSLLPCIVAHSFIDVTSVLTLSKGDLLDWIYCGVLFVVAIAYCVYLAKRVETPPINRIGRGEERSRITPGD